jgi:hypothetical protein
MCKMRSLEWSRRSAIVWIINHILNMPYCNYDEPPGITRLGTQQYAVTEVKEFTVSVRQRVLWVVLRSEVESG